MNVSLIFYAVNFVLSLMGVFLMGWWIKTMRTADDTPNFSYWLILLLFVGSAVYEGANLYAMAQFPRSSDYLAFISSPLWPWRMGPITIVYGIIIAVLIKRFAALR